MADGNLYPYCKIVLSGALPGGEQWASEFALINATVGSQSDLQGIASAVASTITGSGGLGQLIANKSSAGTTLTNVRAYWYDAAGPAKYTASAGVTGIAGAATNPHPNQCTVVVTLLTGLSGRSYRGRMYLPFHSVPVSAGKMSSTDTASIATGMQSWFNSVDGGAGGYHVAVASHRRTAINPVTSISVGDVYDTQRRRRDKLVEIRSTASINP